MSTTRIPAALRRLVRQRAAEACEYCLIPEAFSFATHAVDHIVAEKHGGLTIADNLALSCPVCSRFKGSDLASIDPESGEVVPLYHPRRDCWSDHFRLVEGRLDPRTAIGRVTVRMLQLNHSHRIEERLLLAAAGIIRVPPTGAGDHF